MKTNNDPFRKTLPILKENVLSWVLWLPIKYDCEFLIGGFDFGSEMYAERVNTYLFEADEKGEFKCITKTNYETRFRSNNIRVNRLRGKF